MTRKVFVPFGIILMAALVGVTLFAPTPEKWVGRAAITATFTVMMWRRYICMALYTRHVFYASLCGALLVPVSYSITQGVGEAPLTLWLYPLLVSALMTASFYGLTKGAGRMA